MKNYVQAAQNFGKLSSKPTQINLLGFTKIHPQFMSNILLTETKKDRTEPQQSTQTYRGGGDPLATHSNTINTAFSL